MGHPILHEVSPDSVAPRGVKCGWGVGSEGRGWRSMVCKGGGGGGGFTKPFTLCVRGISNYNGNDANFVMGMVILNRIALKIK